MQYNDFTIIFTADSSEHIQIRVIKSLAGEATASFAPPFSKNTVNCILREFRRSSRVVRNLVPVEDREPSAAELGIRSLEDLGSALFKSLFVGHVGDLFQRCLGQISGQQGRGLRIKLRLNPGEKGLGIVYSLPWEFLYKADTREFLGLSRSISIVRALEVAQPAITVPMPSILRILAVVPSPVDAAQLDLEREIGLIQETFKGSLRRVLLDVVKPATLEAIQEAIQKKPYHILHFSGHGVLKPSGRSGLIFEDAASRARFVESGHLADILRGSASLRLVVVNACDTAAIAESDAFSSVASALVAGGMPAVIANQFPISDEAAISFSRAFYGRLAKGRSLDEAVADGRLAIRTISSDSVEWGTPTLFSRLPENALFSEREPGRADGVTSLEESAVEAVRVIEQEERAAEAMRSTQEEPAENQARQATPETPKEAGEPKMTSSETNAVVIGSTVIQSVGRDIFQPISDLTEYVVRELEAGYSQARREARSWSIVSLVGAGLGLALIVATTALLLVGKTDAGIISAVSTFLTGSISALCFAQYRASNRRVDGILRELSQARDIRIASEVASTINDPQEQDRIKGSIVKRLLENADRKVLGGHTVLAGREQSSHESDRDPGKLPL